MTGRSWAILLATHLILSAAVLFLGGTLPPCLGDATGQVSAGCLATWEAGRLLFPDRFTEALGGPVPASAVTFLTLTGVTMLIDVAYRWRRRRAGPK